MAIRSGRAELCALTVTRCVWTLAVSAWLLFSPAGIKAQENRKLIKKADPVYPELARKMNLTGVVKVEINVAADGSVTQVRILGGHPVLAEAVEDAVKHWKYQSGPAETKRLDFKFDGSGQS